MSNLTIVEYPKGVKVLTTAQLAEVYETEAKNIHDNFTNNKDRFVIDSDYVILKGAELKAFKNQVTISDLVAQRSSSLFLWTSRGDVDIHF